MKKFVQMISRHEDEIHELHSKVLESFSRRKKSDLAWRDWELAAKRFREFRSEVDDLLERCLADGLANDCELRDFAFGFVECDPYYFRSGYEMESLLRKIKKLNLSDTEKALLRDLILKRIDTKALRNFRQICRLIPLINTSDFRNEVVARTCSTDSSVSHRAEFALSYFPVK